MALFSLYVNCYFKSDASNRKAIYKIKNKLDRVLEKDMIELGYGWAIGLVRNSRKDFLIVENKKRDESNNTPLNLMKTPLLSSQGEHKTIFGKSPLSTNLDFSRHKETGENQIKDKKCISSIIFSERKETAANSRSNMIDTNQLSGRRISKRHVYPLLSSQNHSNELMLKAPFISTRMLMPHHHSLKTCLQSPSHTVNDPLTHNQSHNKHKSECNIRLSSLSRN